MRKPRILYVDDEQVNLMLFQAHFKAKFDVLTAASGEEGLKIMSEEKDIDVVFSDMKMPHMNGIEFIHQASKIAPDSNYHIISAFDLNPEIREALDQGLICNYFGKPFRIADIESAVNTACAD